jgi:hypothetical protein
VRLGLAQLARLQKSSLNVAVGIEARTRLQIACYRAGRADEIENDFGLLKSSSEMLDTGVTFGYRHPPNERVIPMRLRR